MAGTEKDHEIVATFQLCYDVASKSCTRLVSRCKARCAEHSAIVAVSDWL
jgi:hypothetical protein